MKAGDFRYREATFHPVSVSLTERPIYPRYCGKVVPDGTAQEPLKPGYSRASGDLVRSLAGHRSETAGSGVCLPVIRSGAMA
jgi:hypothetical protein